MSYNLDLEPISLPGLELKRPFLISGPCSAETEEQTLATAKELAKHGYKLFRAGIWKPRTRPGAFEGVGTLGLPWLKKVKEETGMFVCVEVANTHHVYEALKFGIDVLWIGARTTANPFAVQEIADALKGIDIPVLIKNPVNPDIDLWIGAIERINQAGIKKIGAIHRGFSSFEDPKYRNSPHWQIPIELRRRIPNLPIINDPSHISGKRELLKEVSQEAMDLNFDGLIVESHINPDKAWSDAAQQLTPDALKEMIDSIVLRKSKIVDVPRVTLDNLRTDIDALDNKLLELLKERMKISEAIGKYKLKNNITILQTRRYDEILTKRRANAVEKGLNPDFVIDIFESIHEESIHCQNELMNKELKKKKQ